MAAIPETQRYEVTMEDGWKVRLNARSEVDAKISAEQINRFGHKAVSTVLCEEFYAKAWCRNE